MRYGSVCSGIGAPENAWEPLGWNPVFNSEIEPFPCSVLAHHHGSNMPGDPFPKNGVPNYGDMTNFKEWPDHGQVSASPIDLLVGGTPCQSFSIAGLRKGLADDRGNLMLTYLEIAARYRPRWLVWENVPGALSSFTGAPDDEDIEETGWEGIEESDFACFLRGLEECGYHAAWRVCDAQYVRVDGFDRAVPQRRRRLFVIGYLGDWRPAAAVLFERESLQGHPAPRRKSRKDVAPTISARPSGGGGLGTDFDLDGGLVTRHDPSVTLTARDYKGPLPEADLSTIVAHKFSAQGFDASEDGSGRGTPIVPVGVIIHGTDQSVKVASFTEVSGCLRAKPPGSQENSSTTAVLHPIAFYCKASGRNGFGEGEISPTLRAMGHKGSHQNAGGQVGVAFAQNTRDEVRLLGRDGQVVGAIAAQPGMKQQSYIAEQWAVRRLTPLECERLQGFPDGYTNVPYGRRNQTPDGPRYKALGNSMAVNVMRWIGRRIEMVEALL